MDKPWWLAGGIPPEACVAAYRAKGASSLEASKINLANPGTYTLTAVGTAPTWNDINGWIGSGAGSFNTGIVPIGPNWSMAVKISDLPPKALANDEVHAGMYHPTEPTYKRFQFLSSSNGLNFGYGENYQVYPNDITAGIVVLTADKAYVDGVPVVNISATNLINDVVTVHLLGRGGLSGEKSKSKIQLAALYNIKLSDSQVSAISTAMANI